MRKSDEQFKGQFKSAIAWLEKQGETSPILSNSSNIGKIEQKPSWSKDDNKMLYNIIQRIKQLEHFWNKPSDEKMINWLKSLKPNHWKPSDEQIKSLRIALQTMPYSKDKENVLIILEQLTNMM